MITRNSVVLFLSQSRRFFYNWCTFDKRKTGFLISIVNLKSKPLQSYCIQNVNSRFMSLTCNPVPNTEVKNFLDHLVKIYVDGENTEFDKLLQDKQINRLIIDRLKIIENIKTLKELEEEDAEMKRLAKEEISDNENQLNQIDDELINLVLKRLALNSHNDVIMEINAGVGGQEAMLFGKDLFEMYLGHLSFLGYKFDVIELDNTSQGGLKKASIMISGDGAFEKLKHEAGNHRVQRVPVTEKSGRIHTSVVSVAVLPQPSDIEIELNPKDLRIDTMRSSGAGGQSVNTTNSAVRIVHLPTGTIVESQEQRSQTKNREVALIKLRTKLYQTELDKQLKNSSSMRKQQMGMGERNEKIRTYNFNQDRITDHRLTHNGTVHNLKGFLEGGEALDNLHEKLNKDLRYKLLSEVVKSIK